MSLRRFFTILVLLGVTLTASLLLSLPALAAAGPAANVAPAENAPHRFAFQGCLPAVTVTSAGDDGAGSLRQAIVDVCDGGTIDFAAGLAGQTISLTSAELTIAKTVTIANPAAPGLAVSGNAARRVFMIQSSGVVTLSQLRIVNGAVSGEDYGGGIANYGRLTVLNSTLSGNAAPVGGGIYNRGSLSVVNSTLSGNWATEAGVGGGVCNNTDGQMTISNSTLSGNSAYDGGGVYNNTNGTLTISNSSLVGNSASGDYSTGGGITNYGTLTVLNSTLSGNSASYMGGGIATMEGTSSVQNSTLSGNSAGYGGGIFSLGTLALANTIIANSPAGGDCQNSRPITADHSLVEATGANACGLTDGVGGNIVGVDPLLGPLGAYGGETRTHALLPGSRALDAGLNCLAADQRGVSRPQPAGGACDTGAFERAASVRI